MKRKDFLKGLGLAGAGALLPFGKMFGETAGSCVVIPTETSGPYPILATQLAATFRTDIRETQVGQLHTIKLKIIGDTNCLPIANAEVDIWHCNVYGNYSGYTTTGKTGTVNATGETWLRGRAMTDANGEVTFTSIFPGWYSGRLCHVHFEVKINGTSVKISQFTYPTATKDLIHTTIAPYSQWGIDPATAATDNVFSDGTVGQISTLVLNGSSYDSYLEVTVPGTGAVGINQIEKITGGQFTLGQNYPNPFVNGTTIPFILNNNADVSFGIYDLQGKKVAEVKKTNLTAGEHKIIINTAQLGIAHGTYAYEIEVSNSIGKYHQCKIMTGE